MEFNGFNVSDVKRLNKVWSINKNHFHQGYDSKFYRNQAHENNGIVFQKLKALMQFIKDDQRFSNFEIGLCRPNSQNRGKWQHYLWIWLVDKKLLDKHVNSNVSPKLCVPQIQVSIHPNGFTSAEIWYEKNAFGYRKQLIEFLKNKYNDDKKLWFFAWHEDEQKSKFDKPGILKNITPFIKRLSDEFYNEAKISIEYDESFLKKTSEGLVNIVIEDLLYMIKRYYEPMYGKIIYQNIPVTSKGKGGHKRTPIDPERRKEIETRAYDVVEAHFRGIKYEVDSVAGDNVGWDLEATGRNEKLLLEVKGLSGDFVNIELTPNEYTNLKRHKNNYRVCVVTKTLDSPVLYIYTHQQNVGWIDQYGNLLKEVERTGLKMYWE